eukprot:SAG22_NODE_27_length_29018_cov_465.809646_24_plen_111_part_00
MPGNSDTGDGGAPLLFQKKPKPALIEIHSLMYQLGALLTTKGEALEFNKIEAKQLNGYIKTIRHFLGVEDEGRKLKLEVANALNRKTEEVRHCLPGVHVCLSASPVCLSA